MPASLLFPADKTNLVSAEYFSFISPDIFHSVPIVPATSLETSYVFPRSTVKYSMTAAGPPPRTGVYDSRKRTGTRSAISVKHSETRPHGPGLTERRSRPIRDFRVINLSNRDRSE